MDEQIVDQLRAAIEQAVQVYKANRQRRSAEDYSKTDAAAEGWDAGRVDGLKAALDIVLGRVRG